MRRPVGRLVGRVPRREPGRVAPGSLHGVVEAAAALRGGATPEAAWADQGVRCDDAVPRLTDLVVRLGLDAGQAAAVVGAARCAHELGAAPAAVLVRVAEALEADERAAVARRAALAGPHATARLLLWLPVLGLALGTALGARPWAVLLDGGTGTALGGAGVLLALAGRRWSRHLVAAAAGRPS